MKVQLAKEIFRNDLYIMKEALCLAEFKFGRDTADFQYFRKQIMDTTYSGLLRMFQHFEREGIIRKCECNARLKQGASLCEFCGGSGYRNVDEVTNG